MILDLSAGKRAIWLQKLQEDVVFCDIRPEMLPNVITDTRQLPFPNQTFSLIVFDPPHMVHGKNSDMGKQYGCYTAEEIKDIVYRTGIEAFRVAEDTAYLAFKWNNHDVRLDHTLPLLIGWEPLFGHHFQSGKRSLTSWLLLRKRTSSFDSDLSRILSL